MYTVCTNTMLVLGAAEALGRVGSRIAIAAYHNISTGYFATIISRQPTIISRLL